MLERLTGRFAKRGGVTRTSLIRLGFGIASAPSTFPIVSGTNALALGNAAEATGIRAIALGFNAEANHNSAVAIGDNAQATERGQFAFATDRVLLPQHITPMKLETSNATPTILTEYGGITSGIDATFGGLTDVALAIDGMAVAFTQARLAAYWSINCLLVHTAGTTSLPHSSVTKLFDGTAGVSLAAQINDTSDLFQLLATGIAATQITWSASLRSVGALVE